MKKYKKVPGESKFWRWLKGIHPCDKALAWCHTTDAFTLEEMIDAGSFVPQPCKYFAEDLLYFFYGRPAFRPRRGMPPGLFAGAPVVIVLEDSLVNYGKRMFPFDTGAFEKLYKKWIHPGMELGEFELACPSDAAQRFVASFYECNANYLRVQARNLDVLRKQNFYAESICAMLEDKDISRADNRRVAIELQADKSVPFAHPAVRALIVPDEILNIPFLVDFRAGPGKDIEFCEYQLTPLSQPREYQGILEKEATELQRRWGLV